MQDLFPANDNKIEALADFFGGVDLAKLPRTKIEALEVGCRYFFTDGECVHGLLHVDHDHGTGKIRGLLCSRCNQAIGLLRDDISIIMAAARYVQDAA